MNTENRAKAETATRCLSGGTVLQTADGPRPIEELVGFRPFLFACHPDDGHVNVVQADRVFVSDRDRPMVRVSLDDGSRLDCTPDHPFMLDDGSFEEAHRLRGGSAVRVLEDAMKSLSFTETHVRTIGQTGYRKAAPPRSVRELLLGHPAAEQRSAIVVDPVGDAGGVRVRADTPAALSARDGGMLAGEPLRIYGQPGSTTQRVVAVDELPDRAREVYDVSMPALHNFAAGEAGVFVHNRDGRGRS